MTKLSCHLKKLLLLSSMSITWVLPETAGYPLRVRYWTKSVLSPMLQLLEFFLFISNERIFFFIWEEDKVGKLKRKLYTQCSGCCKILSFMLCNLEKSTNYSKPSKALIYCIFLWHGLGYAHDLERERRHRPAYESHHLTSYQVLSLK